MPNMEARTVANIMVEEVIARFGVPDKIHSDQGRQFESALFTEMCKILQIEKTRTTPYHPQSDGMVERFNRTLLSMLSAFVNQNHNDWDDQLALVMMAYRSCEQETTSCSPNMLMLGREVTTPLDLMYEMPPPMREIPANQWVWELKERLERIHGFVRDHTGRSMNRQKKYRDRKIAYEQFVTGDRVYVFFPVTKVGTSSKLTSFWKGPFAITEKLSDVLYKVVCGRAGADQVIHCDRLKKAKQQTLSHENTDKVSESENQIPDPSLSFSEGEYQEEVESHEVEAESHEVEAESHEVGTHKRVRKKPQWLQDYVLCFRRAMPNLKTTVRKQPSETDQGPRVRCNYCGATFKRLQYMMKHMRRVHQGQPASTSKTAETKAGVEEAPVTPLASTSKQDLSDDSSTGSADWDVDPGIELVENAVQVPGCTVRKATRPAPVCAPKRPKLSQSETDDDDISQFSLKFSVQSEEKKTVRRINVENCGELIMESKSQIGSSMELSLKELVGDRQVKSGDVVFKIKDTEIEVGISYRK